MAPNKDSKILKNASRYPLDFVRHYSEITNRCSGSAKRLLEITEEELAENYKPGKTETK